MDLFGETYDYQSIKIVTPFGNLLDTKSISYGDSRDDDITTGNNGYPNGVGRGEYSGTCTLEMARHDYNRLANYAAGFGGFYNLPPVDIVVTYAKFGREPSIDKLQVHFHERDGLGGSKGDTKLTVTVNGKFTKAMITADVDAFTPDT